jgi:hypothetical protein
MSYSGTTESVTVPYTAPSYQIQSPSFTTSLGTPSYTAPQFWSPSYTTPIFNYTSPAPAVTEAVTVTAAPSPQQVQANTPPTYQGSPIYYTPPNLANFSPPAATESVTVSGTRPPQQVQANTPPTYQGSPIYYTPPNWFNFSSPAPSPPPPPPTTESVTVSGTRPPYQIQANTPPTYQGSPIYYTPPDAFNFYSPPRTESVTVVPPPQQVHAPTFTTSLGTPTFVPFPHLPDSAFGPAPKLPAGVGPSAKPAGGGGGGPSGGGGGGQQQQPQKPLQQTFNLAPPPQQQQAQKPSNNSNVFNLPGQAPTPQQQAQLLGLTPAQLQALLKDPTLTPAQRAAVQQALANQTAAQQQQQGAQNQQAAAAAAKAAQLQQQLQDPTLTPAQRQALQNQLAAQQRVAASGASGGALTTPAKASPLQANSFVVPLIIAAGVATAWAVTHHKQLAQNYTAAKRRVRRVLN